jgi:hypothetical protein
MMEGVASEIHEEKNDDRSIVDPERKGEIT